MERNTNINKNHQFRSIPVEEIISERSSAYDFLDFDKISLSENLEKEEFNIEVDYEVVTGKE